jgi:predicted acylesterase/phospholipase RssA
MFKGERIIDELRKLVGERDIETLDIGFTAMATDLNSGREVWFSKVRCGMRSARLLRSMDTMQTTISRMKLAAYSPQLIITVPGNLATFFEFHRAPEMIDCGYRATETALRREGY